VYDFMSHQLTHNKSYAHRLPPTFVEQARHWANFHEQGVFTDKDMAGVGNSASAACSAPCEADVELVAG
jgi:lysosomal acid phosphatase